MYIDTSASTRICLNAANADTATKLAEPKTIEITGAVTGSVQFDGSADANIVTEKNHTHLVNEITDLDTYAVPKTRTVNGKALSSDITLTYSDVGAAAESHTHLYAGSDSAGGPANSAKAIKDMNTVADQNKGEIAINTYDISDVVYDSDGKVSIAVWDWENNEICPADSQYLHVDTADSATTSSKATKLATARTLTIGSSGKTFDGSADVSWTLSEIGAAAASHSHSYLPLSGGTITGILNLPCIELTGNTEYHNGGYIDFHFDGSTDDYTSRIIEDANGRLYIDSNINIVKQLSVGGIITGPTTSCSWINATRQGAFNMASAPGADSAASALSIKTTSGSWGLATLNGQDNLYLVYGTDTNYDAGTNQTTKITFGDGGSIYANKVYGAVWNDYAEFRISDCLEPGRVVCENGDDTLSIATKRLQPGASIISDTYGFAIGETDEAKCPIAVSGRVLVYGYEDRDEFKLNIGRPVCAGPNGTVSIMTDDEYKNYGYCAIGTISAVPDYEEWGTGKIKVNNRIWIKVA